MKKNVLKIFAFVILLGSLIAFVTSAKPLLFSWPVWVFLLFCINLSVWQKLMRLATFTILVIWSFALLGNLIPQASSGPSVALGDIERTPDEFIAAGEAIYYGNGKCATCHTIGDGATEGRCPDLANIDIIAESRRPGMSAKDYFVESLYMPSDYLVPGYGKIMPEVWKPPVALTPLEIETVIAFLQSQGGVPDLTPIKPPVDIAAFEEVPQRKLRGDIYEGQYLFDEHLECISCHKVGELGGKGGVGPDLTEIGALNTLAYLEESILDPSAQIVMGYGYTMINLKSGEELSGIVVSEDEGTVTLNLDENDEAGPNQERVVVKEDIVVETIWRLEDVLGEGFFWIEAVVNDSTTISGMLAEEDEISLTIESSDELVKIEKNNITQISGKNLSITSKMPKYDEVITIRQFEDLLTYLVSLKGEE